MVTSDPDAVTPEEKDRFAYDLSCRAVRKNRGERSNLRRTLEIGRELESSLSADKVPLKKRSHAQCQEDNL